jgi:hypothetical protein
METPMKRNRIPVTDSIRALADFWDQHDLTEFEVELEEVPEPVFEKSPCVKRPVWPCDMLRTST